MNQADPSDPVAARRNLAEAADRYAHLQEAHAEASARLAPLKADLDTARADLRLALKELPGHQAIFSGKHYYLNANGGLAIKEIEVIE